HQLAGRQPPGWWAVSMIRPVRWPVRLCRDSVDRRSPPMGRCRNGQLLWISLLILFIAAVGVASVAMVSQSGMRRTAHVRSHAEAYWTARAALAEFENRLKMKDWDSRFYAAGTGTLTGDWTHRVYREVKATVRASDVLAGGQPVSGLTDVFVTV